MDCLGVFFMLPLDRMFVEKSWANWKNMLNFQDAEENK